VYLMSDPRPCPCCDLLAGGLTPLEALALGVALGQEEVPTPAQSRGRVVLMCEAHQGAFREAVVRMLQKVQTLRHAERSVQGGCRD
jgi:hypothetical protein